MIINANSFGKDEKLCSKNDIEVLYKKGSSFLNFPVVFYYMENRQPSLSKVLVSVSKKKFKRAVDRNLIKRRLREAYRSNKLILKKNYDLAFVYVGNEMLPYQNIEASIIGALDRINNEGT